MNDSTSKIITPRPKGTSISKAIEILNQHAIFLKTLDDHSYFDSICLSIEALTTIKGCRITKTFFPELLLPGETKD